MSEIDSSNFDKYFFDIRTHRPQPGQVLARFRAVAQLVAGDEKRFMVKTLMRPDAARSVANMMVKVFHADKESSLKIPIEMAQDLLKGMSEEEVVQRPYEYIMELFYYTMPEYIPLNDPHWEVIKILDSKAYIHTECTPPESAKS